MLNTYSIDYLFDADKCATATLVSDRKHWTVGMVLFSNGEEEAEENREWYTEHQADNYSDSK